MYRAAERCFLHYLVVKVTNVDKHNVLKLIAQKK